MAKNSNPLIRLYKTKGTTRQGKTKQPGSPDVEKIKHENATLKKCLRIALDRLEDLQDNQTIQRIKDVANGLKK